MRSRSGALITCEAISQIGQFNKGTPFFFDYGIIILSFPVPIFQPNLEGHSYVRRGIE